MKQNIRQKLADALVQLHKTSIKPKTSSMPVCQEATNSTEVVGIQTTMACSQGHQFCASAKESPVGPEGFWCIYTKLEWLLLLMTTSHIVKSCQIYII